jgi:hypothetical protein
MSSHDYDTLESFAQEHDITLSDVHVEDQEAAAQTLSKAAAFERRGLDERADTLRAEAAEQLGADLDTLAGGSDGSDGGQSVGDTLSKAEVADHLEEFDLDTLASAWKTEETIETLEMKAASFERRGVDTRADTLREQIACLKAAKAEVESRGQAYDSVDTLAKRITGDHHVLTFTPDANRDTLGSRQAGGSDAVTLSESGPNEYLTEPRLTRGSE